MLEVPKSGLCPSPTYQDDPSCFVRCLQYARYKMVNKRQCGHLVAVIQRTKAGSNRGNVPIVLVNGQSSCLDTPLTIYVNSRRRVLDASDAHGPDPDVHNPVDPQAQEQYEATAPPIPTVLVHVMRSCSTAYRNRSFKGGLLLALLLGWVTRQNWERVVDIAFSVTSISSVGSNYIPCLGYSDSSNADH